VRFGVHIFQTDEGLSTSRLAVEVESRGFESLWLPEHTHIPTSRESPYLTPKLPREYLRVLDPFIALTVAATATTRLRLGTGICLLAQHDPVVLAKTVASLDQVSGGRVLFGVGLGWNIEEMRTHGVDPKTRRSLVREKILLMQGLWGNDEFEFDGQFVRLENSWSWPKPVQAPLPVHMGGSGGPLGFKHVVEFAQGWMPDLSVLRMSKLQVKLDELDKTCAIAGRDRSTLEITLSAAEPEPDALESYVSLGTDRCIFLLPSGSADIVLPALDRLSEAVSRSGIEMTA
jgi:probable F420-dependent oxidoreductase